MATPESKLKDYLVQEAAKRDIMLAKTSTPHWPDWSGAGRKGQSGWLELKAPGKVPTAEQWEMMERLHARGHLVMWTQSRAGVDAFLDRLGRQTAPPRAAQPRAATSTPTTAPKRSQGLPTTQAKGALRLKQKRPLKADK